MRIDIATELCVGAGLCALTAPNVFTQDDEGFSAVLPGQEDGADDPLVPTAIRSCPVQAISFDE